MKIFSCSFH